MSSLFSAGGVWAEKHSEQLLSLWERGMAAAVTGQVSPHSLLYVVLTCCVMFANQLCLDKLWLLLLLLFSKGIYTCHRVVSNAPVKLAMVWYHNVTTRVTPQELAINAHGSHYILKMHCELF
jgi:hypothetical protein